MNDFQLKPRHFCIVMRLWISVNLLFWLGSLIFNSILQRKGKVLPHYCLVTVRYILLLPVSSLSLCWHPRGDIMGEAPHCGLYWHCGMGRPYHCWMMVEVLTLLLGFFWYYCGKALGYHVTVQWKLRLSMQSPMTLQETLISGHWGWKSYLFTWPSLTPLQHSTTVLERWESRTPLSLCWYGWGWGTIIFCWLK